MRETEIHRETETERRENTRERDNERDREKERENERERERVSFVVCLDLFCGGFVAKSSCVVERPFMER